MNLKKLEILTATIEISAIRVDGQRMTKAAFRQILGDYDTKVLDEDILGWVNDDRNTVILFSTATGLRKRILRGIFSCYGFDYSRDPSGFSNDKAFNNSELRMSVESVQKCFPQLFIAT